MGRLKRTVGGNGLWDDFQLSKEVRTATSCAGTGQGHLPTIKSHRVVVSLEPLAIACNVPNLAVRLSLLREKILRGLEWESWQRSGLQMRSRVGSRDEKFNSCEARQIGDCPSRLL